MSDKLNSWRKTTVAAAALLVLSGLCSEYAYALSLGRINVQSLLGEPLRAQIEVINITAEEAQSLKAAIASADAFSAAGLAYSPATADLQVSLQRQAGGRAVIELSSQRPNNDPFIDLLIEATWASGRIVRDYTLLFDPPSLEKDSTQAPTPAQTPAPALEVVPTATPAPAPQPSAPPPAAQPSVPVPVPVPAPQPSASAPAPTPSPVAAPTKVLVKPGDTASAIALRNKPADISLDQMLVALLRANPNAFFNNNINRLKTGALVTVPPAGTTKLETDAAANKIIVAQSLDFNDYRRKLAAASPKSTTLGADRKASGNLEIEIEVESPRVPSLDKLTLSKGGIKNETKGASPESLIALELAAKDSAERAAEIEKNISDLSKLGVTTNQAALPPLPAPSAPASASIAPTLPAAPVPAVSAAIASASAPNSVAAKPKKNSPSWFEELINSPFLLFGAAGLMVAVAGFGFFRHKQRNAAQNSILGAHLEPQTPNPPPTMPYEPTLAKYAALPRSGLDLNLDLDLDADAGAGTNAGAGAVADTDTRANHPLPLQSRSEPAPQADVDRALPVFVAPAVQPPNIQLAQSKAKTASAPDVTALDFDLSEAPDTQPPLGESQDSLETKLALAHEFSAIGDEHGARALIEEVIAEASGALKTKAKLALSQLQAS